jgi:hypothetical protein
MTASSGLGLGGPGESMTSSGLPENWFLGRCAVICALSPPQASFSMM